MSRGQKMLELVRVKENVIYSCLHPTRHNVPVRYDEERYDSDLGVEYLPLSPDLVTSTCGSPPPSGLVIPTENQTSKCGVSSVQENEPMHTDATELLGVNQSSADGHSNADNLSVVALETNAMECHSFSLSTSCNRNQSAVALETNVAENRSRSSSTSSSSSSKSSASSDSSSSSSSSSSEDCDDLLNDQTYDPKLSEEDSGDSEHEQITSPINQNTPNKSTSTVFSPQSRNTSISTVASTSSSTQDTEIFVSPAKKGRKRKQCPENWKRNIIKKLRNSGEEYEIHSKEKKTRKKREIKPPCGEKCKLKCSSKFDEAARLKLFTDFWSLANLDLQRQFIANSMNEINPKYRYVRIGGTRNQRTKNNAFYFNHNNQKVRVCKLFFKNTLDINDRPIRTVIEKRNKIGGAVPEPEKRGKHTNHKTIDPAIRQGIREFIESIPKIESHYTRAKTSRQFIDGSRSLAQIHRDYVASCTEKHKPSASYTIFTRTFNEDFNISFFVPKKDLCETCVAYQNCEQGKGVEEENPLQEKYDTHLVEKKLSREEKQRDKTTRTLNGFVAVYDLQAVMQIPKGDVSVFYYKSKLNVLNFTIYDLHDNSCECYVWDEANGNRGVNELGSCILKYLEKKATMKDAEIIFYSDNCVGQQKNKFMLATYLYAVRYLGIKSITHKFLIKGHTQNEGDSAHSLIERQVKRQLKSGPIYTPEGFISAIKAARKKGNPFSVNELSFTDFYDIKDLASSMGPVNLTGMKISEVKIMKVCRDSPASVFYKTSYTQTTFAEIKIIKKKAPTKCNLKPAFFQKPGLAQNKKTDLLELLEKHHIPQFYHYFYSNL